MCTTGVVTTRTVDGERVVLGVKTSDSLPSQFWHGIVRQPGGARIAAYGLVPQQGINAGLNEHGLLLISAYLDYRHIPDDPERMSARRWTADVRGMIQADILDRARTAREALDSLYREFARFPDSTGGVHLVADAAGELAVFEHCDGRAGHEWRSEAGYAARGNNGLCIYVAEQDRLPGPVRFDRTERHRHMEETMAALSAQAGRLTRAEMIAVLRETLAAHGPDGPERGGTICSHGVDGGVRSNLPGPHYTLSAMIWDVGNRDMFYTDGYPCARPWHTLRLEPETVRCEPV